MKAILALAIIVVFPTLPAYAETTRFCIEGELDLGARYQGTHARGGEFYPTTFCVISDDHSERAQFTGAGKSNPDMYGEWSVAYLPPDMVRILNRKSPPDIEFSDTDNAQEARAVRRLDPHRLLSEYLAHPERFTGTNVEYTDSRLLSFEASADMPLRGRVPVIWRWEWSGPESPRAELRVDGEILFRGTGHWATLTDEEAAEAWSRTPGADPIEVPGIQWPSRVSMEHAELAGGVHLVTGVRSGFQHLVVETSEGLVIGDAPAGWVELHHLPAADMVPGLGISGLSEKLIDFIKQEWPQTPIAAVALTHHHDDHAGGARAFAAAGAAVYAPAPVEAFLEKALNRSEMPADRLSAAESSIDIIPVAETVTIGEGPQQVRLVPMGSTPHVSAMLGVWAAETEHFFVSDIHVPRSEDDHPSEHRAVSECWFADWAVKNLPQEIKVVNSHSGVVTPGERLSAYLESEICQAE
jgi:glyoxylase-like metal-dependent hydrolase (beta-lactamase superfamily II)